ncbi:hypothetical protein ACQ4PT_013476 [Festuca glaucescens]
MGSSRTCSGLPPWSAPLLRQRLRVAGLQDGYVAAQFFRIHASKRRRRNHISVLRDGEQVAVHQVDKEGLATAFFAELLGRPQPREHDLSLAAIGLPRWTSLGSRPTSREDEVWATVKVMPANKSPGPDNLSWEFFRACWSTVKADVLDAILAVSSGRDQHLDRLNSAFITLLPKKEGAADLKEFRPISLMHSFAKLLTKIMALRLAPCMADLVDCNQSAFIRGSVLRQNRFGPRWIGWLVVLLRSASTQVLVNGCEGPAFLHGRGLWQGDPPVPLLFVLVMDVLVAMFRSAERAGVLVDLSADGLKHRVSLYADDIVVFARPDKRELLAARAVLACFGAASSLVVNYARVPRPDQVRQGNQVGHRTCSGMPDP